MKTINLSDTQLSNISHVLHQAENWIGIAKYEQVEIVEIPNLEQLIDKIKKLKTGIVEFSVDEINDIKKAIDIDRDNPPSEPSRVITHHQFLDGLAHLISK